METGLNTLRKQNVFRNIFFGVLLKLYQTIVPFLMRTIIIYTLGVAYLGLNSLFASVLQILNLAELGISQAMIFCMYRPIAENNHQQICELLKLYRIYYFLIGLVILIAGIILLPFLPYLISGNIPGDVSIYALYFIQLLSTVVSYWLFSYRSSLLEANQRNDLLSKIQMITLTIQFVLQLIALLVWKSYYLYIAIQLVVQVIQQFLIYYFVKRFYPQYKPSKNVNNSYKKKISSYVKDLATAKFGAVILNSGDTIVISAFLGLSILAIYQNYFYLITAVIGFMSSVLYGALAGIGNSIVTDSIQKVYKDFKRFTFIISWLVCICTTCFLCMFQPFMKIWVGENLMLDYFAVILLCIYFYIYEYNQLFNLYKDAAGLWHTDRFRPFVTSIINLGLNIILVQFIGIYGVILSTIISILFVGMPWLLHNLFSSLFQKPIFEYLKTLIFYVFITILACVLSQFIISFFSLSKFKELFLSFITAFGISNLIYIVVFYKKDEFQYCIETIRDIGFIKRIARRER